MKKLYIIANWKSNKTEKDVLQWMQDITSFPFPPQDQKEIIICAPVLYLPLMRAYRDEHKLPLRLGAQDISPFGEGAYTGEINGTQIKEYAEYVLIGHSERRRLFHEDDVLIQKKVDQALESGLQPIVCVLDETTPIPNGAQIIAYELATAIGTGTPDSPENAERVASMLKQQQGVVIAALYGASVSADNTNTFTTCPSIDGVLVGGASLDVNTFTKIITNS